MNTDIETTLKEWLKRLKLNESTISMFLGIIVVIIVGTLLYNYFSGSSEDISEEISVITSEQEYALELEEEADGEVIPSGLPLTHTVSSGDHLWMISEKYYGNGYNWVDIASENNLNNPGLISDGQELTIPKVALRVPVDDVMRTEVEVGQAVIIDSDNYTVSKGDTLWSIAVRAYQDGYQWPKIYQNNRDLIQNPDIIEVGMELKLPR